MKTKTYFLTFSVVVFLAVAFWIVSDHASVGDVETNDKPLKYRTSIVNDSSQSHIDAELTESLKENERLRDNKEGNRLIKKAFKAIDAGEAMRFREVINEIIYRYEGDPNPLVLQLDSILKHEDPQLRILAAQLFLLTNLNTSEAIQVLRGIIRSSEALTYEAEKSKLFQEEFPPSDYRFRAADTLALYRIEEARDDVWELYKKTGSDELIRPLRRMNDPRMVELLKEKAIDNPTSIKNMKLIGEFRMQEALPELKRIYEDKNSNPDLRFRTLYPLWRITEEDKYFDEFAAAFLPAKIPVPYLAVGEKKEHQYLVEMLKTEQSDILYMATMALHLRFNDDEHIKKMLITRYENVSDSNFKNATLARRLVGSIDDPRLNRVAEEYEAKYETGFHDRYAVYRKNWRYPEWEESLFME